MALVIFIIAIVIMSYRYKCNRCWVMSLFYLVPSHSSAFRYLSVPWLQAQKQPCADIHCHSVHIISSSYPALSSQPPLILTPRILKCSPLNYHLH